MTGVSDAALIHRGFLNVGARQVHYRWTGSGPVALFIHSSPANSSFVINDMLAQAHRYTCIAFDTPGFGLSDPLLLKTMKVADLADATAETMDAIGLTAPVPVFGTHTGAAIALELGYRHPAKVACLALDGVPIFDAEEIAKLDDGGYFKQLAVDPLGGHFSAMWTRFRDQSIWFPWFARSPDALNPYDSALPESTHRWAEMFYAAANHYKAAYRAAIAYGEDGFAAAKGLSVPAAFMATKTDMLLPHLDRLPALGKDQKIVDIGSGTAGKYAATSDVFDRFGLGTGVKLPRCALATTSVIRRQVVIQDNLAMMVRYLGDTASPAMLILHDAPGSGFFAEPVMQTLANDFFVIAPDIPGSGDSSGLAADQPIDAYAAALWQMCDALRITRVALRGHGLGASLALAMAVAAPDRTTCLEFDGLLLPGDEERDRLQAGYAPPIAIEPDGAHWYRLWTRLRDSLIYWPWFEPKMAALRRVEADLSGDHLHNWTVEVMKQYATCHHFILAALRHDAASDLARCRVPLKRLATAHSPIASAYLDRLDALLRNHAYMGMASA